MIKSILLAILAVMLFSGCVADYFTFGKNQSYCEENGCDYADAGVCKSPFDIIQNKQKYNKESYSNIPCEQKGEN